MLSHRFHIKSSRFFCGRGAQDLDHPVLSRVVSLEFFEPYNVSGTGKYLKYTLPVSHYSDNWPFLYDFEKKDTPKMTIFGLFSAHNDKNREMSVR